jgi:phospholipid/cholesterol/gamma-HCH transport system substrate-binding protein
METRPPTVGRILIAVGFVISCFALALFLWLAFGGAIPLKPEGYRFTVPFDEATQLAQESDVRISGVSVGKVKRIDLGDSGLAEATIEVESRYAPIPSDTRAILRQKTLLGETYVELTPGSNEAESLPEGGALPVAQVSEAVQLDEIFRTFDERTRSGFRAWMQGGARALRGRGEDLSVTIASLDPFAREADRALRLLDSQSNAVSGFFRSSGEVFGALSERQGQLRGLIESSAAVFDTTARRNEDLATAFEIFPTFLRESRETLARLERFANDTDPLVLQLRPSARELAPTFTDLGRLSEQLVPFFGGLRGAIEVAPKGSAALRRLLNQDLPPLLDRFNPFLARLNPILEGLRLYRREITAFLANVAATTQGSVDFTGAGVKHIRTEAPLTPEVVTTFPNRLQINRTNPYLKPGSYLDVRTALASFETRQCTSGTQVTLPPRETTVTDPSWLARTEGDEADAADLYDRVKLFTFEDQQSTAGLGAPACTKQAPFESIGSPSETSDFLHVYPFP